MGWILQGLSEVLISIIGDLLSFLLKCFTNFKLDIGYSDKTTWGDLFSLSYYKKATGLIDTVFTEASNFFPLFTYIAYEVIFLALFFKVVASMMNPDTGSSESPLKTVGKAILAALGVCYSYTIFIMIEMGANSIYKMFKDQFKTITKEDLPDIADYLLEPNMMFQSWASEINLFLFFLEIGLFGALLFQYLRLVLEAFERYVVLAFLFYTCPIAFSAIMFGKDAEIFKKWLQMLFATFICIFANLVFLGVFHAGFVSVFSPGDKEYLFKNGADFIAKMCLLIAWLTTGQKVDEILRSLGLSVAQTGHGLGLAVIAGIDTAKTAAKTALNMTGSAVNTAENIRKGEKEATENDMARSEASGILASKGDSSDTVRSQTTSSELQAHLAGTEDAFTSDVIGSDGARPEFNDADTRASMSKLGVDVPSYGTASMTDGKVTVKDSDGSVISEAGDARRWEAPHGAAMFTQKTENGSIVRAATQEDITSATASMVSSLQANTTLSDGISWQTHVDEEGHETGLAIGYDESGSAKYAAYVDGACSMDSDYGRVHELTTPDGNTRHMSDIEIPHSNGATYKVQNLQDTEHQTKHFGNMENFAQNGVKFNRAAESHELVKKSVSTQNAYSFAHAPDKQRWKASTDNRNREIRSAERTMARTDPKFESKNAKRYRALNKRFGKNK